MAKKLWGGRFKKKIDKDFEEFSKSIHYDYKLADCDTLHSIIHAIALSGSKILTAPEAKKIIASLQNIRKEIKNGKFKPNLSSEDVHTEIQNKLEKKIGKLALKLHTLRSRNDQIVFDEKFYCSDKGENIRRLLFNLMNSLTDIAKKYKKQKFIGYTHTQRAQVVLFNDYLLAFGYMFLRDIERIKRFLSSIIPYIGAGALAGSSLEKKDYNKAIKEFFKYDTTGLKIPELTKNPLDNVSDRDFIIEFLSILSIIQMHLSRLAEDLILYSTKEFNFIELPEEFCTGSSLMPHKKNPDFLELVRGYTGRTYGNLISVLTTMKGLPLTYNRDMQLDKEPLFSSVEIVEDELKIMSKFIKGIRLKTDVIKEVLKDKTLYATELAEWLTREQKVPFRQAHDKAGKVVLLLEKNKGDIKKIDGGKFKRIHPKLNRAILEKIMNAEYAISMKKTFSKKIPKRKKKDIRKK